MYKKNTYPKQNTNGNVKPMVIKKNALGIDSNVWLYIKLYNGINPHFIVLSINSFIEFIVPVKYYQK